MRSPNSVFKGYNSVFRMDSLRRLRPSTIFALKHKIKRWSPTRLISTSSAVGNKSEQEARQESEIPGPKNLPYIGTLHKYFPIIGEYDGERPVDAAAKKQKKYGNIIKEELLPGLVFYYIFDPADFETTLRSIGKYPRRPLIEAVKKYRMENNKANGLGELNGEAWHRLRQAVQKPMMNVADVQRFLPLQGPVSNDLVRNIRHRRDPKTLEVEDLMNEFYRWSLESISVAIFGGRMGCMDLDLAPDSLPHRFIDTVGSIFIGLSKTFMFWPLHRSGKTKVYKQMVKDLNFLYEVFDIKEKDCLESYAEDKSDIVPLYISMLNDGNISKADVQTAVADLFFGGAETTGNTLGFLLYNLAKNPDVQEKLYEEISSIIPRGSSPEPTSFNNAPYLKAVIKENFRACPSSIGNLRIIPKDTVLAGYKVPKGSAVFMQNAASGLDEKYIESPNEFKPERWLRGDEKSSINPYLVSPFGHGPRICVGRRFAEQELYLGISALINNFKFEYHHEDIGLKNRLVGFPDKPLRFAFIDRK